MPAVPFAPGLSPFTFLRRMAEDMDRLFQDFGFGQTATPSGATAAALIRDPWRWAQAIRQGWSPQIETLRRGDNLVVRADLPGMKREDVKVELENDMLTLSGERREERDEKRDDYFRSERNYGRFMRAIPLPEGVKPEDCQASFKDGVLEVTIPLPKEATSARREIKVS